MLIGIVLHQIVMEPDTFSFLLVEVTFHTFFFLRSTCCPAQYYEFSHKILIVEKPENIHLGSHFHSSAPQRITKPIHFKFCSGHEYRRLLFNLLLFAPIHLCSNLKQKKNFPQWCEEGKKYVRNMFAKINLVSFCVTTNKHKLSSSGVLRQGKVMANRFRKNVPSFYWKERPNAQKISTPNNRK